MLQYRALATSLFGKLPNLVNLSNLLKGIGRIHFSLKHFPLIPIRILLLLLLAFLQDKLQPADCILFLRRSHANQVCCRYLKLLDINVSISILIGCILLPQLLLVLRSCLGIAILFHLLI